MEILIQEIQTQLASKSTLKICYRETIETFQKYLFISNQKFFSLKRDNFNSFGQIVQSCLNKFYAERETDQSRNRLLLKQLADLILKIDLNCGDETFCAKMIDKIHENLLTKVGQEPSQEISDKKPQPGATNPAKSSLSQKQFGKTQLDSRSGPSIKATDDFLFLDHLLSFETSLAKRVSEAPATATVSTQIGPSSGPLLLADFGRKCRFPFASAKQP